MPVWSSLLTYKRTPKTPRSREIPSDATASGKRVLQRPSLWPKKHITIWKPTPPHQMSHPKEVT